MTVSQWLTPREVRRKIAEFDTTGIVVATLAGIQPPKFSQFLNSQVGLTDEAQTAIDKVFGFFDDLVSKDPDGPGPNLRNVELLKLLLATFLARGAEKNLVGVETDETAAQ